jgi:hypothetical protein
VLREAGPDRGAQVERAYQLLFARPPGREERGLADDFLREGEGQGLVSYCRALLNTNEFLYID